jgi:glutamate N-acetyltransferase / amino-acid N-acetyltransferase
MAVAVARPQTAAGAVTAAAGFEAGAVHAGIRKAKLDLAVVRSTLPAVGAGMFTANQVQAAPVLVSKANLAHAEPQAVVINSGVANAATGKQGELDALETVAETAALLGIDPEQVLVLSTGVIGTKLPMPKLLAPTPRKQSSTVAGSRSAAWPRAPG